jgi:hypothetical protein
MPNSLPSSWGAESFIKSYAVRSVCLSFILAGPAIGQQLPKSSVAAPIVRVDPSQCSGSTQIGKYRHCLILPPTLALTDAQFTALANGPAAGLDASQCTKIGRYHHCPIAPPIALDLTKEQFDALTNPSNK